MNLNAIIFAIQSAFYSRISNYCIIVLYCIVFCVRICNTYYTSPRSVLSLLCHLSLIWQITRYTNKMNVSYACKDWAAVLSLNSHVKCLCSMCFNCVQQQVMMRSISLPYIFNPLTAKLFNLNFHPFEVVSRWRDPQLQVCENYSDLTKWRSSLFRYC